MTGLLFQCSGNSSSIFVDLPNELLSLVQINSLPLSALSEHPVVAQTHVGGQEPLAAVDSTGVQIIQAMFVLCVPLCLPLCAQQEELGVSDSCFASNQNIFPISEMVISMS